MALSPKERSLPMSVVPPTAIKIPSQASLDVTSPKKSRARMATKMGWVQTSTTLAATEV